MSSSKYTDLDSSDDEESKTEASDASDESDSSDDERSRGSQSADLVGKRYLKRTTCTRLLTFFDEVSISELVSAGEVTLRGSLSGESRPAIITRVVVVGVQTADDIVLGYNFPWLHEKQPLRVGDKQLSLVSTNTLALPRLVFEASGVSMKSLKHVKSQSGASTSTSSSSAKVKIPNTRVELEPDQIEFLRSRNRPVPDDGYVSLKTLAIIKNEMLLKDDIREDLSSLVVMVHNLTTQGTKELGEIEKTIPIAITLEISYVC